jgi:hypothetical protein
MQKLKKIIKSALLMEKTTIFAFSEKDIPIKSVQY